MERGFRARGRFQAVATVCWVVIVTNAFNLLDNMDGLAAGIAAIIVDLSLRRRVGERSVPAGESCPGTRGLRSRISPVQLPSHACLYGRLGELVSRIHAGGAEPRPSSSDHQRV